MKNQQKKFYTTFKTEKKDIIYLDKGFDKIIINFVRIEIIYSKYHMFFFSNFKLHKQIKASYAEKVFLFFLFSFFSLFLLLF